MPKIYFIHAEWDDAAAVWVATSDDVPGLATEADTIEALSAKFETLVPELLDANGQQDGTEVPLSFWHVNSPSRIGTPADGRQLCA